MLPLTETEDRPLLLIVEGIIGAGNEGQIGVDGSDLTLYHVSHG